VDEEKAHVDISTTPSSLGACLAATGRPRGAEQDGKATNRTSGGG